jgi:hypothetical protein
MGDLIGEGRFKQSDDDGLERDDDGPDGEVVQLFKDTKGNGPASGTGERASLARPVGKAPPHDAMLGNREDAINNAAREIAALHREQDMQSLPSAGILKPAVDRNILKDQEASVEYYKQKLEPEEWKRAESIANMRKDEPRLEIIEPSKEGDK